jgi:uncharacterized membrane protein YfcA
VPLSPTDHLIAALITAVATFVQGSVGFGSALIAAPLLVLIDPMLVPAPLILMNFCIAVPIAYRERDAVDIRGVGWALAGRVPGTLAALAMLRSMPREMFPWIFSALILLAVALSITGKRVAVTTRTQATAGFASGVMGTLTSVGGPPVALLYQHAHAATLRGTLSGFFIFSTTMSSVGLWAIGLLGWREVLAAAWLLPGCFVGFVLSSRTRNLLNRRHTRRAVLLLSTTAALALIAKQL